MSEEPSDGRLPMLLIFELQEHILSSLRRKSDPAPCSRPRVSLNIRDLVYVVSR